MAATTKPAVQTPVHWIKIVIFGLVLGFAGKYFMKTLDKRAAILQSNDAMGYFNDERWSDCVVAYDLVIARHGELLASQRQNYITACLRAADASYEDGLTKGEGMEYAVMLYEKALPFDPLPTKSHEYYIDGLINTGRYADARRLLDTARQSGNFDGRLPRLDEKLKRLAK